jgi:hypothetical protein
MPDEFLFNGEWTDLTSSNVAKAKYSYDAQTLSVQFRDGSIYDWVVPPAVANQFITSSSYGRAVKELGKGKRVI